MSASPTTMPEDDKDTSTATSQAAPAVDPAEHSVTPPADAVLRNTPPASPATATVDKERRLDVESRVADEEIPAAEAIIESQLDTDRMNDYTNLNAGFEETGSPLPANATTDEQLERKNSSPFSSSAQPERRNSPTIDPERTHSPDQTSIPVDESVTYPDRSHAESDDAAIRQEDSFATGSSVRETSTEIGNEKSEMEEDDDDRDDRDGEIVGSSNHTVSLPKENDAGAERAQDETDGNVEFETNTCQPNGDNAGIQNCTVSGNGDEVDDNENDDVEVEDDMDDDDDVPSGADALRFSGKQIRGDFSCAVANTTGDEDEEEDDDDEEEEDDGADNDDDDDDEINYDIQHADLATSLNDELRRPDDDDIRSSPIHSAPDLISCTTEMPEETVANNSFRPSPVADPQEQHDSSLPSAAAEPNEPRSSSAMPVDVVDNVDEQTLSVPHTPEPSLVVVLPPVSATALSSSGTTSRDATDLSKPAPGSTPRAVSISPPCTRGSMDSENAECVETTVVHSAQQLAGRSNGMDVSEGDENDEDERNDEIDYDCNVVETPKHASTPPQLRLPPPPAPLQLAVATSPPPSTATDPPTVNSTAGNNSFMSPSSFRSTDEMKYYLKHHLQYSDLGKLFGNVDVSSVSGVAGGAGGFSGGGQMGDYAQYLGLQPSVKFKCFKCAEATFASLSELKQHQVVCLKQHLTEQQQQQRGGHQHCRSTAAGRRSSLNSSDNAMDVDQAQAGIERQLARHRNNTIGGSSTASAPSTAVAQQQQQQHHHSGAIDAKIRITRKVYLCAACGTYYENWNLFYHMREVHQKFICLLCLGIFPTAERLLHHLEGKHAVRPDVYEHKEQLLDTIRDQCYLMCTVCEHVFNEHDDYTSHSCEHYIKACGLCGLKFIHKPQCKSATGATSSTSGAAISAGGRHRRDKGATRSKAAGARLKRMLPPNAEPIAVAATNGTRENPEPTAVALTNGGLNFSTMFANHGVSLNGSMELPHLILQNQSTGSGDVGASSFSTPQSFGMMQCAKKPAPAAENAWLPSESLLNHTPQPAPQTPVKNPQLFQPQQPHIFQSNHPNSVGAGSEDYLENRDMDIINSYINDFDTYNRQQTETAVSKPTANASQSLGKSINFAVQQAPPIDEDNGDHLPSVAVNSQPSAGKNLQYVGRPGVIVERPPTSAATTTTSMGKRLDYAQMDATTAQQSSAVVVATAVSLPPPPRLVPKLKLKLGKDFQSTNIESDESSSDSDDDDDDEEEDEDDEDADEDDEENNVYDANETNNASDPPLSMPANLMTPSNASRTPQPLTPHSFIGSVVPTPPHQLRSIADSDMQIDVERTSDMAADDVPDGAQPVLEQSSQQHEQQSSQFPAATHLSSLGGGHEEEDVNVEDEDKDSSMDIETPIVHPSAAPSVVTPMSPDRPLVPFDGIHLADDDTPTHDLLLPSSLGSTPVRDLLRICLRVSYPHCLYCNHARKIAVNGAALARHMLAQHRFRAIADSITAEEYPTAAIVAHLKGHLDALQSQHFNMDTYDAADASNNRIVPKSFECFQCRFQARHHKDLYLHNRKMHLKTVVVCLMCKTNFYSYSELSGHICPGAAHTDPAIELPHPSSSSAMDVPAPAIATPQTLFRCQLCPLDRISSAFRLMVHLRKKHGACDICLEPCADQARLSAHVCKHKLQHLCYRCGISYRNKADITKHLFWKHGTESQQCKRCAQKKWPHVYHFCVPPATFACDVCGLAFRRAVALKVHRRLHSDNQPYPCTEDGCEKKFISRKLLLKHVARHGAVAEAIAEAARPADSSAANPAVAIDNKESGTVRKECDGATTAAADTRPDAELKSASSLPAPKPLIDIIKALPAPNLSESDSSDDSETEPTQRPFRPVSSNPSQPNSAGVIEPAPAVDVAHPAGAATSDDAAASATDPVADIWENFKTYQAQQQQKPPATTELNDYAAMPPPPPVIHVSQSDHDYCSMYRKPVAASGSVPAIAIKQEPIDDYEMASTDDSAVVSAVAAQQQQQQQSTAAAVVQCRISKPMKTSAVTKSPKKGRSPKKALDKSDSSGSGSDSSSDSSCSCGSNCSCSSGSSSSDDDDDSSSSSSSGTDSSSSEGRRKKAAKKTHPPVKSDGNSSAATKPAKSTATPPEEQPIDVGGADKARYNDPDNIILESDLETDESDTDEDFYDEHPQLLALLAAKRKQLLLHTAHPPFGTFDIIENSRPSTPSLPPAEDPHGVSGAQLGQPGDGDAKPGTRRPKVKKRKKDRKSSKNVAASMAATVPAEQLNLDATGEATTAATLPVLQHQPASALPRHLIGAAGLSSAAHLTPVRMAHQKQQLHIPAAAGSKHTHNTTRLSTGSATSCSDADPVTPLKRSKRRRIPNKFYGYTSDEDNVTPTTMASAGGGLASLAQSLAMDAFKPQPPPQLTWCKEDLPQPMSRIRTPPPSQHQELPPPQQLPSLKTVIKLTASGPPRVNSSSVIAQPSIVQSAAAQPPIPPIIIRPNRQQPQQFAAHQILQPPIVCEPQRVPNIMPVHHIDPAMAHGSQFNTAHGIHAAATLPSSALSSDSSDSSGGEGQLQIMQTPPVLPAAVFTPPPIAMTFGVASAGHSSRSAAGTPRGRSAVTAPSLAGRKRASKASTAAASKAKRQARNMPKTPAIPARLLQSTAVIAPPPLTAPSQQQQPFQRPAVSQLLVNQPQQQQQQQLLHQMLPLSAVANQIRYPIMPPAGCRPAQPGESVYCYCRCPYDEVSEMIACDGDACPIEWFHFECVNIMVPPKGTWYCPQCRPKYAVNEAAVADGI